MQKIGIICASDEELAPFLASLENADVMEKALLRFYQGQLMGVQVVVLYSGVCKVNAAIAAQLLVDFFQVDAILNVGVAGGIAEHVALFDTVISTKALYHDMDEDVLTEFHPWLPAPYFKADARLLEAARTACQGDGTVHFGPMATGDRFIRDDMRQAIAQRYAPLGVDMETTAIAHVCYVNRVPFLAIRTITDTASHEAHGDFEANCAKASAIAKDVALRLLAVLASSGR